MTRLNRGQPRVKVASDLNPNFSHKCPKTRFQHHPNGNSVLVKNWFFFSKPISSDLTGMTRSALRILSNDSCSISVRKVRICPLRARIYLNKHIFHTLADCVVCWVQKSHILEFWNFFHSENSQNTHFRKNSVKCYKWIVPFRHIRLMCVFNELWRVRGPFWKVKTET